MLYQVVRLAPKSFRARHKGPGGRWVWNTDGVRIVPYHLDEVVKATNEIYITEGEKDANTLSKIKLVATCNPFGAEKWRSEFAAYFKGREVVICPDADEKGHKHCLQVGQNLLPVAKAVSVLVLPPGLKDVTDLYEDGHEVFIKRLQQAASEAKPFAAFQHGPNSGGSGPDLHAGAQAPFPLASLPPTCRAMARAIAATVRVPDSLAGCCVLGILSAACGGGLQVRSGTQRVTRGNVYVVPSAVSGAGKSETFRHAAAPLCAVEREAAEEWKTTTLPGLLAEQDIVTEEIARLKKRVAKAVSNTEREEIKRQLMQMKSALAALEQQLHEPVLTVEDVTSEELAVLLAHNNETLASISPDAGAIIANLFGRYSANNRTDENIYLKAWSGDYCKINRRTRGPVSLAAPCLAALWLVQPDKLEELFAETSFVEGGLIPRFLACHTNAQPQPITGTAPGIPPDTEAQYGETIRGLAETYRLAAEPQVIVAAPEATAAFNAHFNSIVARRAGEFRDITTFAARWNEQAWRLAVCIHAGLYGAAAHGCPLVVETAGAAIVLADWFAGQQLAILQAGRADRALKRAQEVRALLVGYGGAQTLRELQKRNCISHDEARQLAKEYPGLLAYKVTQPSERGGRPGEILRAVLGSKNL